MGQSLSTGLKEAERPRVLTYPKSFLADDGIYGAGHREISKIVHQCASDYEPEKLQSYERSVRLCVVSECERAKEWLGRQRDGRQDYWHARIEASDERRVVLDRAISAVQALIECDRSQPYWIRHAWVTGLAAAIKEPSDLDEIVPNANLLEGGERIVATGRVKEVIEEQFVFRTALMELGVVLEGVHYKLEQLARPVENPWKWLGNMRVDPPLSRRSKSSISFNGDAALGIAVLGLACALSQVFRLVSTKRPHMGRWIGEEVLTDGRACWSAVCEYVNSAFDLDEPVNVDALRQRWRQFSRGRMIWLHQWPQDAIRESQLKNNHLTTD